MNRVPGPCLPKGLVVKVVKLQDTLWSRILEDHSLFFAFAGLGSALIIAFKVFTHLPMLAIAAGASALMLLYAFLVSSKGIGKLRNDQAGDNCYYLGLIYTLTSLAHAIFAYDPTGSSNEIVNGFGVALATTILGLILRVMFNQSRLDIHEIEGQARLELVEAAAEMKTKLGQVAELMGALGAELRQSIDDMRRVSEENLEHTSKQSLEAIESIASAARENLEGQVELFGNEIGDLTKAAAKSKRALTGQADALQKLSDQYEGAGDHLRTLSQSVERISAVIERLEERQKGLDAYGATIEGTSSEIAEMMHSLRKSNESALSTLATAIERLKHQSDALEAGPSKAVGEAAEAITSASNKLTDAIADVASRYEKAGEDIGATNSKVLEALSEHNSALDTELEKSRGYVASVHSALVEMADELRTQVAQKQSQ